MSDVERDDVREMREQGDLGRFLRDQIRAGRDRLDAKPQPAAPPRPSGHRPGAWPTGTSPPGPPPERSLPPEVWADAIRRYRTETRQQLDQEDQ